MEILSGMLFIEKRWSAIFWVVVCVRVSDKITKFRELDLQPSERRFGLHVLPLLDGSLEFFDEVLVILDDFRRQSTACAVSPIRARAMDTIQLLGELFEPFSCGCSLTSSLFICIQVIKLVMLSRHEPI